MGGILCSCSDVHLHFVYFVVLFRFVQLESQRHQNKANITELSVHVYGEIAALFLFCFNIFLFVSASRAVKEKL